MPPPAKGEAAPTPTPTKGEAAPEPTPTPTPTPGSSWQWQLGCATLAVVLGVATSLWLRPPGSAAAPAVQPHEVPYGAPSDWSNSTQLEVFWATLAEHEVQGGTRIEPSRRQVASESAFAHIRKECEARAAGGDFSLYKKEIGDTGAYLLSVVLKAMPRPLPFNTLDLRHNEISVWGIVEVMTALKAGGDANIQGLYLGDNPLKDDGVEVIVRLLPPRVTHLHLGYAQFGDRGAGAVGAAMGGGGPGRLPSLRELYLPANDIRDDGAVALASGLPHPALEVLWLQDNGIGNVGAETLAAVLPSPTLRSVFIYGNQLEGSDGRRALLHARRKCPNMPEDKTGMQW
jgi:hypothetical protein